MSIESNTVAEAKPTTRSRVTNGSVVLPGVDGRSTWVRRLRDLITVHIEDLGGEDSISEAERSLVRRAATMTVELERMEAVFAVRGEADPKDLELYQRTAGNLRRILESLGLQRRQRDITPTISEYAARRAAEKAAERDKDAAI